MCLGVVLSPAAYHNASTKGAIELFRFEGGGNTLQTIDFLVVWPNRVVCPDSQGRYDL